MADKVKARSPQGLEILQHAFSEGGRVLEFKTDENGERYVMDVTDHYEELQEHYDESEHSTDDDVGPEQAFAKPGEESL